MYKTIQWKEFASSQSCKTLREYRHGWYHDRLLHQLKDPYMRIIRKCRLGQSELAQHSFFHNPEASNTCQHCHMQQPETLSHFFLQCPAHAQHRSKYLASISPILKELELPQNQVKSFLGFNDRMTSKFYCRETRCKRKRLYEHTCDFMRNTKRFRFV